MPDTPSSQDITKQSGSNLALSFMCLDAKKQRAMSSFYAFCRIADDIVDDKEKSTETKQAEIDEWRKEIEACYKGTPKTELGRELKEIAHTYLVPPEPFFDILDGVEMDLTEDRYATFQDLERYCYRVASAVGLVSIEIFGYTQPAAKEYAVALGMAFQLTNILRDVRYDLEEYGRIYIPQDEIKAFGVSEADLLTSEPSEGKARLFRLHYFRARHYFAKAARLLPQQDRDNFTAAEIMTEVYFRLLEKLRKNRFELRSKPIRLNRLEKLRAVFKGRRGAAINRPDLRPPSGVTVMGAGFAGIGAAVHLAISGHRVKLLESKAYLGGRAHSFTDGKSGLTLDNGQHIFMGAYKATLELFDLLGVEDKLEKQSTIRVPYRSEAKGTTFLAAADLPAPFHLLAALLRFRELSLIDKISMLWMGVRMRLGARPGEDETAEQWLKSLGQTANGVRALWEPFCVAALNEPVATASARLLHRTLELSLFGGKEDASIYISRVGLSDLFTPELQWFLSTCGGEVVLGDGARTLNFNNGTVTSLVTTRGNEIESDLYVSALPWSSLRSLLPEDDDLGKKAQAISSSPIVSLHLITDVMITEESFVGLLDSPVHWIFNRDRHHQLEDGQHISSVVVSAAYETMEMSSQDFRDLVWKEVNRFFPHTRDGKILHHILYRSKDATFAAQPGTEKHRPGSRTPWNNLLLAGDWTRTGLPGTLEGAVLSGRAAARLYD